MKALLFTLKLTWITIKVLWPIVWFVCDVIMTAFLIVVVRCIAKLSKSTIVVYPKKRNHRSIW